MKTDRLGDRFHRNLDKVVQRVSEVSIEVKLVYLVSTCLMVFQQLSGWNWDFNVYSMNGEYIFTEGIFMEWLRPPLAAFLMGLPQLVVSRSVAELLFVVFTSTLFLYSSVKVCRQHDLELSYFYPLLMTPITVFYGTMNGTEMLSLSFGMLFFSEINRKRSGIWLGLSFLARYPYAVLIPLVLTQKNLWKSIKTVLLSAVPVLVWMGYNFVETGFALKSFANYLGLQLIGRSMHDPLNPINLVLVGLPVTPLLLLYVKEEFRSRIDFRSTEVLFVLGFVAVNLVLYMVSNPKPIRYLYPMAFPIAYFSTRLLQSEDKLELFYREFDCRRVLRVVSVISLVGAVVLTVSNPLGPPENFRQAADSAGDCMVKSQIWPHISYSGTPALPIAQTNASKAVQQGYRIVDYRDLEYGGTADLPVVENTSTYTTYGNSSLCRDQRHSNKSWIQTDVNVLEQENHTPRTYLIDEIQKAIK